MSSINQGYKRKFEEISDEKSNVLFSINLSSKTKFCIVNESEKILIKLNNNNYDNEFVFFTKDEFIELISFLFTIRYIKKDEQFIKLVYDFKENWINKKISANYNPKYGTKYIEFCGIRCSDNEYFLFRLYFKDVNLLYLMFPSLLDKYDSYIKEFC